MTHLLLLQGSASRFLYSDLSEKSSVFFQAPWLYYWLGSLLGIFMYYFLLGKIARRHRRKVPIPVQKAPRGLSPSAMRYLYTRGFDTKALVIGIISAAQKGCYAIAWKRNSFTAFHNPQGDAELLSPGEKAALYYNSNSLWDRITFSQNYSGRTHKMGQNMDSYYRSRFGKYFARRNGFKALGVLLSLISLYVLFGQMPGHQTQSILTGYILVFSLFILVPAVFLLQVLKDRYWYGIAYSVVFFVVGLVGISSIEYLADAPLYSLAVVPMAALNFICISQVSGYTRKGQALVNEIDSYRDYLHNRFERAKEENLPLSDFAEEIPYAMALDIDYAFTPYFQGILSRVRYEPFQLFDRLQ